MAKDSKAKSSTKNEEAKQNDSTSIEKGEVVSEAKGLSYDVKFSSFPNDGNIKGYCTVIIGGEFAVKGVKVIESSKGLFVAMPSYKSGEEYKDICNPITKEAHAKLKDAVIGAYEQQSQAHQANLEASGMPQDIQVSNVPEGFHYANEPEMVPQFN